MLRQLWPKRHNFFTQWIQVIGNTAALVWVHDFQEIAEVVLPFVEGILILPQIKSTINQLQKFEYFEVHGPLLKIIIQLSLPATHFISKIYL